MIDVFSDASWSRTTDIYAGAYMVGRVGSPVALALDCATSLEAELLASLNGLLAAKRRYPAEEFLVHSDLANIGRLVGQAKSEAACALAFALKEAGGTVIYDARQHTAYQRCHQAARIQARGGRLDVAHSRRSTRKKKLTSGIKARLGPILDVLREHPLGVTEVRLAQESGIGLNVVHKLLRRLESGNSARCERPTDPARACDLGQWKWFKGPSFGTMLGDVLADAGIVLTQEPSVE